MATKKIERYYRFTWNNPPRACPIATTPPACDLPGVQLKLNIIGLEKLPFTFVLQKVASTRKGVQITPDIEDLHLLWEDYLGNDNAWPLMSEKLCGLIKGHLNGREGVHWIEAPVAATLRGVEEVRPYWIPWFEKDMGLVDKVKSSYAKDGSLIVPALDPEKRAPFHFFHYRPIDADWTRLTRSLCVSAALKRVIQKAGCTGVVFG